MREMVIKKRTLTLTRNVGMTKVEFKPGWVKQLMPTLKFTLNPTLRKASVSVNPNQN